MTKIYESPDAGKTVYSREFGKDNRTKEPDKIVSQVNNFMYGEEIGYSFTANANFQNCPPAFSIMNFVQQKNYLNDISLKDQNKMYSLSNPIFMYGNILNDV